MTEHHSNNDVPSSEDEKLIHHKLKARLAIAAALVVVALLSIPILDNLKPANKTEMTRAANNASSGKIIKIASDAAPETSAPKSIASAPTSTASAPATTLPIKPTATSPQTPDLSKTPALAATKPLTPPAAPPNGNHANILKSAQLNLSHAPAPAPATHSTTPAAKAVSQPAMAPVPPVSTNKAQPAGSSVGYTLQLGLFNTTSNAENLVRELKNHGIEAHTETRVQLGPFKTRSEADEASEKLRKLGYKPLLAPAGY